MLRETMFTSTNWFAFQDDRPTDQSMPTSLVSSSPRVDDSQANNTITSANSGGSSSSDDEVVVGDDEELVDTATSPNGTSNGVDIEAKEEKTLNYVNDLSSELEKVDISDNLTFLQCVERNIDIFSVKPPDWVGWRDTADFEGTSGRNPFSVNNPFEIDIGNSSDMGDNLKSACTDQDSRMNMDHVTSKETILDGSVPEPQEAEADGLVNKTTMSLFEENVEFVGVEIEGTKKAMEHALKEGIVGEAGPMKRDVGLQSEEPKMIDENGDSKYNDMNYWRSGYNSTIAQDESL
jgi:serine/threonine-protein phosphatase 6 regulatory subunit 3